MSDDRKAFEEWAAKRGFVNLTAESLAWDCWKAACAYARGESQ